MRPVPFSVAGVAAGCYRPCCRATTIRAWSAAIVLNRHLTTGVIGADRQDRLIGIVAALDRQSDLHGLQRAQPRRRIAVQGSPARGAGEVPPRRGQPSPTSGTPRQRQSRRGLGRRRGQDFGNDGRADGQGHRGSRGNLGQPVALFGGKALRDGDFALNRCLSIRQRRSARPR